MANVEDLINKFHDLEGTSVKERKQALHRFFKSVKSLSSYCLDTFIQNLKPLNYLEETFKIELLLYFKRADDLHRILSSGNEVYASKVIKQDWFIRELFEKYSPNIFVEKVFPKFSFSLRMKVLKKILRYTKDEIKVQDLFDKLHQTYGLKIALVLLPGCSHTKIQNFLIENPIHLPFSQLKLLFDRDPSLVHLYFEKFNINGDNFASNKWVPFLKYIGIKDPMFCYELTKKFGINMCKLGRKSTKKFIDLQKENILQKPLNYMYFLRKDSLVRKLGEDFPNLYKNTLPESLTTFKYHISRSLLKYYNKDKQYDLFCKAFEEKYNKSVLDNIDYMEERLIELIPTKEERHIWIAKFESRGNIKKYVIRKKYAKFQSKMSFIEDEKVPVKERKTIFNTLISTCKLTRDYDAFLNILNSFCDRHINSDVTILYNFLRTVHKELDMTKFNGSHWKYIYQIISVQLFKKQQIFYPIFVEYIKFSFLQNKNIEQYVYILLNEASLNLLDFVYGISKFEKTMLQLYIKLLPDINDEGNTAIQVALSIIKWNKKYSTDKINISKQQNILSSLLKLRYIEKIDHAAIRVLEYLICQQDGNQEISDLDSVYWENFKYLNNTTITMWYAKHKPKVLKENLENIEKMLKTNNSSSLIHILKKYDHLNIPSSITNVCLEKLKYCQPTTREWKIKVIVLFMPTEKLFEFFKEYFPQVIKDNDSVSDSKKQYLHDIQCALMKYLKLAIDLKKFLPELLRYCHGGILKFALPSLYSSFCRIPEDQLYFALKYLETQAVSVRKHSIFLSSLILPVNKVLLKYQQVQALEKNSSVMQHMFLSCFKYFLQNILEECWVIISKYITNLKKHEKQVIRTLINIDKVPKQYRALFTELTWQILEKLRKQNEKVDANMISLLRNLNKNDIMNLNDEFCMDIIENKLFDLEKYSIELYVFAFAKKFILYGGNMEKKIVKIFEILHNFKNSCIYSDRKIQGMVILNQICFGLFEEFFGDNKDEINSTFAKLFHEAWTTEFTIEETFEENLMIDMVLKIDSDVSMESLPERISDFFSISLDEYGNLIISNFKNFLNRMLYFICKGDNEISQRNSFLWRFLEKNSSNEHCILVVELLPPSIFVGDSDVEYKNLIEFLLRKNETVRICLFGKLKSESY